MKCVVMLDGLLCSDCFSQLDQLGFCGIRGGFDEVNPSHLPLLQHFIQFKKLNGKLLVSFHRLGCNIMGVHSNKEPGTFPLLLKWITKYHLRSADRNRWKTQS